MLQLLEDRQQMSAVAAAGLFMLELLMSIPSAPPQALPEGGRTAGIQRQVYVLGDGVRPAVMMEITFADAAQLA